MILNHEWWTIVLAHWLFSTFFLPIFLLAFHVSLSVLLDGVARLLLYMCLAQPCNTRWKFKLWMTIKLIRFWHALKHKAIVEIPMKTKTLYRTHEFSALSECYNIEHVVRYTYYIWFMGSGDTIFSVHYFKVFTCDPCLLAIFSICKNIVHPDRLRSGALPKNRLCVTRMRALTVFSFVIIKIATWFIVLHCAATRCTCSLVIVFMGHFFRVFGRFCLWFL